MEGKLPNEQHILSAFDRDLESIQAMIMKMGGLVEAAITDGARALETLDAELAEKVRQNDKVIDELDERINQEAAKVIALRSPTATDLRTVLSVMRISLSLERIGDFAKNMGKRIPVLVEATPVEGSKSALRRMAKDVEVMLKDVLDAYIQRDAEMAEDVRQRDHEVDQMYNALFRELLTHMLEDPRQITSCMHLHFIAKNVERMGDHVTSIAEQVIYLVEGTMPEESRPKGDDTSYVGPDGEHDE